jgi:hypothetical protein
MLLCFAAVVAAGGESVWLASSAGCCSRSMLAVTSAVSRLLPAVVACDLAPAYACPKMLSDTAPMAGH